MSPSHTTYKITKPTQRPPNRSTPYRHQHRIPLPAYTSGWFYLCTAAEIDASERPLKFSRFGQDLVAYRDHGGSVRCVDAYCPHLGANLGDGRLTDGTIECPFHAWTFDDETGQCRGRQGCSDKPLKLTLDHHHVAEANGFVYLWHHPDGTEPSWTVPDIGATGPDWLGPRSRTHVVHNRVQDIAENAADVAHLYSLHSLLWADMPPADVRSFQVDGHMLRIAASARSAQRSQLTASYDLTYHGVGNVHALITLRDTTGKVVNEILALALITPIDQESCAFASHIYLRRVVPWMRTLQVDRLLHRYSEHQMVKEIDSDTMIWDQKIFLERPPLSQEDGPLREFRDWAKQFYPSDLDATTEHAAVLRW